jgi:hypothetical protein
MARTVTSTNVVLTITVPGLYDSPQQFSGYSTDKVWSSDSLKLAETMMGVDGKLSAGYVPNPVQMTLSLQADSLGIDIFDNIIQSTQQQRECYRITGSISVPATGKVYAGVNGVVESAKVMPDASKVLQAQEYTITWEKLTASLS